MRGDGASAETYIGLHIDRAITDRRPFAVRHAPTTANRDRGARVVVPVALRGAFHEVRAGSLFSTVC